MAVGVTSSHRGKWCRGFLRRQPTITHIMKQKATTPQMTATEMKSNLLDCSPGGDGVTYLELCSRLVNAYELVL